MDVAEVLAIIVDRACSYVPEVYVGESKSTSKRPALTREKVSKVALTDSEKGFPIEERTSVEKKVLASSDFVRC